VLHMKNKKVLNKLSELTKENERLYNRKAELEKAILVIYIQIYKIMGEFDKLIRELYNGEESR
jgi:hypothetical protein